MSPVAFRQIGDSRVPLRCRLICLPHSGGHAMSFGDWPASLPDGWELWAADLPGHGARVGEPLAQDIGAIVPSLTADLVPLLEPPTILFGHSLGAILAFELARALADHPRRPNLVVLCARSSPDAAPQESLHLLDDAAFLARVGGIAGDQARGAPELLEIMLPVLRADFAMAERWQPTPGPPLDIPILAFAGLSDPYAPPASMDGWSRYTRAGFQRFAFPGDHFFPYKTLGTLLRFVDEEATKRAA